MSAADVLERLSSVGVRLTRQGAALLATPREALTDELRGLIRDHKPALLDALAGRSDATPQAFPNAAEISEAESALSPLSGLDCSGCNRLTMTEEAQPGTRRRFFWRCSKGHELLEARNFGSRMILAPSECEEAGDFEQWKAGTR